MSIRQLHIFLVLLLFCIISYGQGEANNWYFGENAGINFNTSPPTALTNGQLSTNEGCSSISDASGNLLFYSDGRTVWNRNHQIMSNANYFNNSGLLGDPSSTSSALIIPKPEDPNLFYIFTVDEPHHNNANAYPNKGPANIDGSQIAGGLYPDTFEGIPNADDGLNNGFNYSVVDMRLEGGLGDVLATEKNLPLITYDPANTEEIKFKCSEKITAVRADDCSSFWVLSHFIDRFYAFKVDASGVNTTPVVSKIGPSAPITSYRRAALGYLKASPNGKKLAIAHNTFEFDQNTINQEGAGGVYLHDFDDITGRVTSSTELINSVNPYSIAFSAETKKVYATVRTIEAPNNASKILQWDLESGAIPNSMVTLFESSDQSVFVGALQLASNSKIYVSLFGETILSVINRPEANGRAADYSKDIASGAIDLRQRRATLGLPPFIQSTFSKAIGIINSRDTSLSSLFLCEGNSRRLNYDDIPGATYTWFKDKILLPDTSHFLDINAAGAYQLEVDLNDGSCPLKGIANISIVPIPEVAPGTLIQCSFAGSTENYFDLTQATATITKDNTDLLVSFHKTQSDATMNQNVLNARAYSTINTTERLYARVINNVTKCTNTTTLDLQINSTTINNVLLESCDDILADGNGDFDISSANDQILNGSPEIGLSLSYYTTVKDAILGQNALTNTNVTNVNPAITTFYARAEDRTNACYGISEIKLQVHPVPILEKDFDLSYCIDGQNSTLLNAGQLDEPIDNFSFLWSPSRESTYEIETSDVRTHTVRVIHKITGCENSRSITIIPSEAPQIRTITVEGHSRNTMTTIVTIGIGDYEYAVDDPEGAYQDSPVFTNLEIGEHMAYARDKNGCGDAIPRLFPVLGFPEFFSPNNDGQNDFWNVVGFQEIDQTEAVITIFDRYGKLIKTLTAASNGWDGTYNGRPLPQSDYWARLELSSGVILNSHFSLLR